MIDLCHEILYRILNPLTILYPYQSRKEIRLLADSETLDILQKWANLSVSESGSEVLMKYGIEYGIHYSTFITHDLFGLESILSGKSKVKHEVNLV